MAKMQYTNRLAQSVGDFVAKEETKKEEPVKETKKEEPVKKAPVKKAKEKEPVKAPKTTGKTIRMHLLLKEEYQDDVELVANFLYKGNKTAYFNDLIEQDLKRNKEKYDKIREMAKSL